VLPILDGLFLASKAALIEAKTRTLDALAVETARWNRAEAEVELLRQCWAETRARHLAPLAAPRLPVTEASCVGKRPPGRCKALGGSPSGVGGEGRVL
jgi:hypothetical protein